jgi:hypothetical protein
MDNLQRLQAVVKSYNTFDFCDQPCYHVSMKFYFLPLLLFFLIAMPIAAISDQRPNSLKLGGDILTINRYNTRYIYSSSSRINRLDRKTGKVSVFPINNAYCFDINDSALAVTANQEKTVNTFKLDDKAHAGGSFDLPSPFPAIYIDPQNSLSEPESKINDLGQLSVGHDGKFA